MKSSKFPPLRCDMCGRYASVNEDWALWTSMTIKSKTVPLSFKATVCTECTKNILVRIQKTRYQKIEERIGGPWF